MKGKLTVFVDDLKHFHTRKTFYKSIAAIQRYFLLKKIGAGIYPNNFDVCYTAQKTQSDNQLLKLKLHIYIFVSLFVFVFCWLLSCWNAFAVVFLAIKVKRYLHVSYKQLFGYLHIHEVTYVTYLNIQKMKI